ncbi:MAG TPA: DUF2934 domain-containing protein [Verrucomicrobiae bacterium]|nr:DUF2934 domain-containing protein [Verrucomicrobiae bacterium]
MKAAAMQMSKPQTKVKNSNPGTPGNSTNPATARKPANGQSYGQNSNGLTQEQIAAKAYQLYVESGCQEGRDNENWLRAEQLLRTPGSGQPAVA